MEFSWNDLSYSVPDPKDKKALRSLLQGMNGVVKSGQVVAIMGSSGAGKSTLLNVLAGRLGGGKLEGSVLVNGQPRVAESWRKLCAYVEQDDL
jgi:ABC-type multidrug transport system ATPase subunit